MEYSKSNDREVKMLRGIYMLDIYEEQLKE